MSYEFDEIKASQEIFNYLLIHTELSNNSNSDLYQKYICSDNIKSLVTSQGQISNCDIQNFKGVIYLIPKIDNNFLGFTKSQLKTKLCSGNSTDNDYYLAMFVILVILVEIYGGKGSTSKIRTFMQIGELMNLVSQYLKDGVSKFSEEEQETKGILFTQMLQAYEALRSDDNETKKKSYKLGFINNILQFLDNQGLITLVGNEDKFYTKEKLDHLMDYYVLNTSNYSVIESILSEVRNE